MINVITKVDTNGGQPVKLIECPKCGQKLMDIRFLGGMAVVRIKCRRCKNFITVDMSK